MSDRSKPVPAPADLLVVALEAAQAGATVVRGAAPGVRFIEWQAKRHADFVSEVDLAAERAVLGVIARLAPHAGVLAEESAPDGAATPLTAGDVFVVDPLDGTTNFLHGYPEYAVSVGVVRDGVPVAGVVIDVALGETFTASQGAGAFVNGARIHVSPITDPARALIGTGFPFTRPEHVSQYVQELRAVMTGAAGIRRAGAAALDLAAVAAGRFEGFWETVLSPWDIAAGLVLVREAGGLVTDYAGAPCEVRRTGVVAGSPAMHAWLLDRLQSVR